MQLDLNVAKPAPALLLLLARRSIACTFAKLPPPPFDVSTILFTPPPTSHAHAYKSAHPMRTKIRTPACQCTCARMHINT